MVDYSAAAKKYGATIDYGSAAQKYGGSVATQPTTEQPDYASMGVTQNPDGTYKAAGIGKSLLETGKGIVKGAADTMRWIGSTLHSSGLPQAPGVADLQKQMGLNFSTEATNQAQQGGKIAEKTAEILAPIGYAASQGKLVPGVTGFIKGIGKFIAGKSETEILSTAAEDVYKLGKSERDLWFKNQSTQISEESKTAIQTAKQTLQTQAEQTTKTAEDLQRQLQTASRDKVIELRPKIIKAMGEQSQAYRSLIDAEMAGKENIPIKIADLKTYIDTQYADNPQMAEAIKSKLGLDTGLNPNPKAPFKTSLGELYNQTKALKSEISAPAVKGGKVFTSDDKLTDDAIHTITDFMKKQGVDFSEANKFWSKYAPIRNQLVSEAKPFLQTGTQTKTFANTLMRVSKGNDVNNENFINEVENLLGEPITKENKSIIAKMAENEKTAIANDTAAQEKIIDAKMAKDTSLKGLNSQQFQAERQARLKNWVKGIITLAATGLTGIELEKAIKKYTGIGF